MQLSELIQEEVIKVGLTARDKWEAIQELVDVLVSAHELRQNDRAAVIEAVCARFGPERIIFGTGLPVREGGGAIAQITYAEVSEEAKAAMAGSCA